MSKPRIGLFAGDPSGIGPELVGKLLAMPEVGETAEVVRVGGEPPECEAGRVSAACGAYCLESLRAGLGMLRGGLIDAMVFAPLNKQAMKMGGLAHEDELHFFAAELGFSGTISEINVCDRLWTSRVTSHIPLREVADLITGERIEAVTRLLYDAIRSAGVESPRVAVAGVNPHAGEGGLMGREEVDVIWPVVERMRAAGMEGLVGPLPADTLFLRRESFDGVVTMYHDQGQIALKLLGFERGVTVAGGLPYVITTPAHGTAFDIVGKGIANPGAMRQAFLLACQMVAS